MDQRRSNIIDIAKCLGIVLMVIGHSCCPQWLHDFIYVFHMPLFFFLSGYCFNEKYVNDRITFIRHRIKGLYIPFVKYNLLFLCLHNLFYRLHFIDAPISSISEFAYKAGGTLLMGQLEELVGPYWFLRYLFIAAIVFLFLFILLRRHQRILMFIVFSMPFVATVLSYYHVRHFLTDVATLSIFFFACGYLAQRLSLNRQPVFRIVLTIAVVAIASQFLHSEIVLMHYQDCIAYCICALVGIYAVMAVSSYINDYSSRLQSIALYVGKHTMVILTWHVLLFKFINHFYITLWHLPSDQYYETAIQHADHAWLWVTYAIVGVVVPLLFSHLFLQLKNNIKHHYHEHQQD